MQKHLFLILFFITSFGLKAEVLLNVSRVKIAKGYTAEYLFDLEQDDNFELTKKIIGGTGDADDLNVYLVDLNQLEEKKIKTFKQAFGSIRIPESGLYKLVFEYTGKGRFSWRSKYLNLRFKVESLNTKPLSAGESRNVLRMTNVALDKDAGNAFKLAFDLEKGDKLYLSSGDQKSAFVKVKIIQLGINKFLNSLNELSIEKTGTYTMELFLEENTEVEGLYQTLATLLKNDDINFSDLNITREKSITQVTYSQDVGSMYGGNSGADGGAGGSEEAEVDPQTAYMEYWKKMQEAQSSSAESSQEQNAAMLAFFTENMKMMEELKKEKEIVEITPQERGTVKLNLAPQSNFALNTTSQFGNRECSPLNLKGGNLYNVWFYWIGVGEQAEEAFNIAKEKFSRINSKNIVQAKSEYYYYSNTDPEKAGLNPAFPKQNDPEYKPYLSEDVEYAIVDLVNSERFLNAKPYSRLNLSKYHLVTAAEGISLMPTSPDAEYFLCVCNNNKTTPVDVFFTYFTISATTKTY